MLLILIGSLCELIFKLSNTLLISNDRLFFLTQPILPPTLELSVILYKLAVFSKPLISILSKIFFEYSSNEIFCSKLKTISDRLYSKENSSLLIFSILLNKLFLSILTLLEYLA